MPFSRGANVSFFTRSARHVECRVDDPYILRIDLELKSHSTFSKEPLKLISSSKSSKRGLIDVKVSYERSFPLVPLYCYAFSKLRIFGTKPMILSLLNSFVSLDYTCFLTHFWSLGRGH